MCEGQFVCVSGGGDTQGQACKMGAYIVELFVE